MMQISIANQATPRSLKGIVLILLSNIKRIRFKVDSREENATFSVSNDGVEGVSFFPSVCEAVIAPWARAAARADICMASFSPARSVSDAGVIIIVEHMS